MLTKGITDMNLKQECVSPADDFFQSVTDWWTDRLTDDEEVIPKCLHAMQATQLGTTIAYLILRLNVFWSVQSNIFQKYFARNNYKFSSMYIYVQV